MTGFRLEAGCPRCGRSPGVRFSEDQVERSRLDRAAGLHSEVQCPRCGHRWWLRNRDVAAATPVPKKKKRKATAATKKGDEG